MNWGYKLGHYYNLLRKKSIQRNSKNFIYNSVIEDGLTLMIRTSHFLQENVDDVLCEAEPSQDMLWLNPLLKKQSSFTVSTLSLS